MAPTIFFILLTLLIVPANTHLQSDEEGFISVFISEQGLDFVKDLLINTAVSSFTPLELPPIEKSVKIPLVGKVHIVLSNITIYQVGVSSSFVKPGESGLAIVASGATANLSMNWRYSYSTWLVPIAITDKGEASVQVEGMEVGLTLGLRNQEGKLRLSLLECGCYVKDVSIKLDGGASWLYQGVVDAFGGQIGSSVEEAVSQKIREGVLKLDSQLQNLPKEIRVDKIAILNITLVKDPVLSNYSIGFEINGLFTAIGEVSSFYYYHEKSLASDYCKGLAKMVGISLHQSVINSASVVCFNENIMTWVVDELPDQSLLNTAGWKHIVPQLYKLYPNDDMNLNISASSPPTILISDHDIDATIHLDVTINVLDAEVIPVACIAMVIHVSGSAEIQRNSLVGSVRLDDFTLSLKWSKIGNLHMHLVQTVTSTLLKTMLLPYANLRLRRGFPLPVLHGFGLKNAEIHWTDSRLMICSDVAFTAERGLDHFPMSNN
ncbi:putative BPI/LBP family protein At1g04970 [Malania oleifera]|uniref:putative BPI/LBP family protein At1g04970 n=1 Tax=Malania oleifera TaxID=397392 RepID=UPI0025ADA30E|nr:putative BPI/LBP family protein At1g04970 [Malania oleifera]